MKTHWKKTLKNVSFMILMLTMCVAFGQKIIIVLDPGHGGLDSGAVGINGIQEKDVVLDIANEIVKWNRTLFENRFEIYLTRYSDTLISLSDRGHLAKNLNADVFISIHCNASNRAAKGIEVYVNSTVSAPVNNHHASAMALSEAILNQCHKKLGFKKRGAKTANFQVLRENSAYYPSILIETGFVTNADEADYFSKDENRKALALGILMGIINYLNIEP